MPMYEYECTNCQALMSSIEPIDTMTIMYACDCLYAMIEVEHTRVDYPSSNVRVIGGGTPRYHPLHNNNHKDSPSNGDD